MTSPGGSGRGVARVVLVLREPLARLLRLTRLVGLTPLARFLRLTRPVGHAPLARLLALVGLAALAASCHAPDRPPNVLWIVWDTVRADHLGLYGYERPTTPNLERWAAGARVYDHCISPAGYTLPAHGSMFTGLYPSEHCAHNAHPQLDDRYTTIAELLSATGYRTYLYSANPHISASGNFAQGFDRAEHPWSPRFRDRAIDIVRAKLADDTDAASELGRIFERAERGEGGISHWSMKAAGELAQEAIVEWLDGSDGERPFFVFVNYMEAHRPLIPPRKYRERLMSADDVDRSFAVDRGWLPTWEYTFGLRDYSDEDLELTRATYDAALLELDELFGRLIDELERAGQLDDTVVIVTSDHGEHLGEQHMLDHQYSLYRPLLRVPLVVHYPARFAPGRDATPVSSFDLFPTLVELAGAAMPAGVDSKARSLLAAPGPRPLLAEDPAPAQTPITMVRQAHPDWDPSPWQRRLRAWHADGFKLIWGSDGRHQLFETAEDPLERDDRIDARTDVAGMLQQELSRFADSLSPCDPGQAPPELTPEQIERLKALGYLGG